MRYKQRTKNENLTMKKHIFRTTLILSLATFILISNSFAENWPRWRGLHNDGISQETDIPTHWSSIENVRWRLPLPGEAASTPIVWEERIFLTSADGDELVLLCVTTEGSILWKRNLGSGNRVVRRGEANLAAPSPSTDGKHVWTFIGNGNLACHDVEGNLLWQTNLQERYGSFSLYFVMSTSPLLDKDRLYIQLIHSNAWLVLAIDKATGAEIWKHERQSDATEECEQAYTSPVIYRDAEQEFLIVHGADYVTAHRLEDGSEIWRCGGLNPVASYNYSLRFVASPVVTDGLIVVPSAKNGPVLGIDASARGKDITNSKWQIWKLKQGTPDVPSPLIHDGLVYLCRENGDVLCIDAETGKQLYRKRTHRHRHRASPIYANGFIYLTARDGVVNVIKAGREFELVATNSIGEEIAASPIVANGTLYLRSYDALYAIGEKK